jgi:hypothetical protein
MNKQLEEKAKEYLRLDPTIRNNEKGAVTTTFVNLVLVLEDFTKKILSSKFNKYGEIGDCCGKCLPDQDACIFDMYEYRTFQQYIDGYNEEDKVKGLIKHQRDEAWKEIRELKESLKETEDTIVKMVVREQQLKQENDRLKETIKIEDGRTKTLRTGIEQRDARIKALEGLAQGILKNEACYSLILKSQQLLNKDK